MLRYIGSMRRSLFLCVFLLACALYAAPPADSASAPATPDAQLDSSANHIMLNVDIFGQAAVGSYYILWDNLDLSDEMKTILTSRNFARDEFFMQNIDREQFEQERVLQLFEDQKRAFFKLFPEDEDE